MKRAQPELALHKAVAIYLNVALPPEVFWTSIEHSGTGAYHGQKLKAKGVKSGVPDILISWEGEYRINFFRCETETGWIELKAPKGTLSDEQKQVRERLENLGHHYVVCKSVSDVARALEDWGVPLRAKVAA